MKSLCGADCANCQWNSTCPGCDHEKCFIARYIKKDGKEAYEKFKQTLIDEFNALGIPGMPKINELYALVGGYINLEYRLPNGTHAKFLDDGATYLGNQLESTLTSGRCFGIAANADFILVCTYEENGENPELLVYKKR